MASIIDIISKKSLINPPSFFKNNVHYEVIMGSYAYGVSGDTSDCDVYGYVIPPKEMIFPHLKGEIVGFGKQTEHFNVWQEHHVIDKETSKEYDFSIYSIIKFFQLCMENNPNMIDSLFVPQRCVLHCTSAAQIVRDNRKLFLHKGSFHKCKGYAYSQLHKARTKHNIAKEIFEHEEKYKIPHTISLEEIIELSSKKHKGITQKYVKNMKLLFENGHKRAQQVREHGADYKFLYHVVRLLNEAEQILIEGDITLDRSREQLKSIRKGEWSFEQIVEYFEKKEKELESLYTTSTLQYTYDEDIIKNLLLNVLEQHYGSLKNIIEKPNTVDTIISDLENILVKYRGY